MLSGTAPDGPTVDKAVMIAKQFGPDVINSVEVLSPQQVMLEVRFVEATRQAGRDLGVQWNVFGQHNVANIGNRTQRPAPVTTAAVLDSRSPAATTGTSAVSPHRRGRRAVGHGAVRRDGQQADRRPAFETDVIINALEQKGVARSLAEPNLVALSGDTASFLAGGEYPIPVPGALGTITIDYKRYGVGLAFTPTVLSGGLINMKIEPEVSQLDFSHTVTIGGHLRAAADRAPRLDHGRAARRPELRDRRPAAKRRSERDLATALARRHAGARRAVPQRLVPEAGDRSRHHRHAAAGASGAARRCHQDAARHLACRSTTSICS